jgi:CRP-like cAMP-binding protein
MIAGKVAVLVDIYQKDELFGESAFGGSSESHEMAATLETTRVMTWTRNEVEELMPNRPRLAIALLQLLTQRCRYLAQRIESCSYDCLDRRLARTLIHFSERFGRMTEDGSTQMMPLSHKLIAQYLGTSRENVTHFMIDFRRNGCVDYSRKGIVVYPDALRQWLGTAAQAR